MECNNKSNCVIAMNIYLSHVQKRVREFVFYCERKVQLRAFAINHVA